MDCMHRHCGGFHCLALNGWRYPDNRKRNEQSPLENHTKEYSRFDPTSDGLLLIQELVDAKLIS